MRDVLFFDKMITPKVITFIYWLLPLAVLVTGLSTMFRGFGGFLGGIGIILLGSVLVRVYCELMILLFKINDNIRILATGSSEAASIHGD